MNKNNSYIKRFPEKGRHEFREDEVYGVYMDDELTIERREDKNGFEDEDDEDYVGNMTTKTSKAKEKHNTIISVPKCAEEAEAGPALP